MSYYNTLKLRGPEAKAKEVKAKTQDEKIYFLFVRCQDKTLTPRRVWWLYKKQFGHILLTSVRRSISTLKNKGLLYETGKRITSKCLIDNFISPENEIKITP